MTESSNIAISNKKKKAQKKNPVGLKVMSILQL